MAVGELAQELGVHPNAVRAHLAKLVKAGLVHENVEDRSQRGRPRLMFTPAGIAHRWAEVPPYQQLSLLLTEVVSTGDDPRAVGRRAAVALPANTAKPAQAVVSELVRQGCRPRAVTQGNSTSVVLENCPFPEAAAANPAVVCAIHMGLLEGLTDELADLKVASLLPGEPFQGTCRLQLVTRRPAALSAQPGVLFPLG
jgi:predicted ArsR family transcriptional regulator